MKTAGSMPHPFTLDAMKSMTRHMRLSLSSYSAISRLIAKYVFDGRGPAVFSRTLLVQH